MNHGEHGAIGALKDSGDEIIDAVPTAVTNVHRNLGPGLFESVHELATMKLLRFKRGFLINFNKTLLRDGIKRVSI